MGNEKKLVVAIDGPAGAGKSSIAKVVALRLSLEYVDSGAIYRSITKKMLDSNIKIDNYTATNQVLESLNIQLVNGVTILNGDDLSAGIRKAEVSAMVSAVSAMPEVRKAVNDFLASYSAERSIIMDGRDIGSVVLPDADYKFYLDASVEERAKRRFKEVDYDTTLEELSQAIAKRDSDDMNRSVGALVRVPDAIYIDTTSLSFDEVVDLILNNIKATS